MNKIIEGADSEEKHEPVGDIDTVVVDSLKALHLKWPIREADLHIAADLFNHLVGAPTYEAQQGAPLTGRSISPRTDWPKAIGIHYSPIFRRE